MYIFRVKIKIWGEHLVLPGKKIDKIVLKNGDEMKSRDLFVWNKSNVLIFIDKVFTALTCYMLNNVHASGQFYLDFIKDFFF